MIMGVYIDDNKLVKITEPKYICIDLPTKINESLEHDIKFMVSCNEPLTEYTIKARLSHYCSNMDMNIKKELRYLLKSLNYI